MSSRLFVTASLIPLSAAAALVAPALVPHAAVAPEAVPVAVPPAAVPDATPTPPAVVSQGRVHLSAEADREIVYAGDRQLRVKLSLWADEAPEDAAARRPTDLVVVMDRSGSMEGGKLEDAKAAARVLIGQLGPDDHFTLVFSDDARSTSSRGSLDRRAALRGRERAERRRRHGDDRGPAGGADGPDARRRGAHDPVSDGLPNTRDGLLPAALDVLRHESTLTAIGIGDDYDEALMQQLADTGGGNFY
ncbi:MAG: hypothetical protein R3F59_28400 [Myxococcota bacterium]